MRRNHGTNTPSAPAGWVESEKSSSADVYETMLSERTVRGRVGDSAAEIRHSGIGRLQLIGSSNMSGLSRVAIAGRLYCEFGAARDCGAGISVSISAQMLRHSPADCSSMRARALAAH